MSKTAAQRQRDSRQRKRDKDVTKNVTCHGLIGTEPSRSVTVTRVTLGQLDKGLEGGPSLEHYMVSPEKYIQRREPDRLNWGPWMDSTQLEQAGLKANRVPIPGDWDYEGAAV